MLLAHAIRNNVVSLAQVQNTYKENVVAVNTLVTSVLTSSLPTLNQNPPDWQAFVTAYTTANADALDWVNNVMARLLDVPDEVQDYNAIISQLLKDARGRSTMLVNDPSDKMALQILNRDLDGLTDQLALVVAFISGAVTNIKKFKDKMPDMATQLQTIANKSTADANADQKQIDNLNADIAALQSEINALTAAIVGLAIADGVALTLGVIATVAAWPAGALVWIVMGPAVAAATTFIVLDGIKIKTDQDKIDSDKQRITGITADVATLHVLANNYANLAKQAQAMELNLQAVLTEWLTLESDVNAAVTEIKTAISDAGAANFKAVLNDLDDAISEWNATYAQAGVLHIDLRVNDAQLKVGMSASEIQAELANGKAVGIIDYYNQLAA